MTFFSLTNITQQSTIPTSLVIVLSNITQYNTSLQILQQNRTPLIKSLTKTPWYFFSSFLGCIIFCLKIWLFILQQLNYKVQKKFGYKVQRIFLFCKRKLLTMCPGCSNSLATIFSSSNCFWWPTNLKSINDKDQHLTLTYVYILVSQVSGQRFPTLDDFPETFKRQFKIKVCELQQDSMR